VEKNEACQIEFYLEIQDNPILYVSYAHGKKDLFAIYIADLLCCAKNNIRRAMDVVVMEDV
jgi:hypothetical protein